MAKLDKPEKTKMNTPVFRVSYPSLFEPNEYGGKKKYQVTCLFPKDFDDESHPNPRGDNAKKMKKLKAMVESVGTTAFGEEWTKIKKKPYSYPIRDGSEKEGVDGYGPDVEFICPKSTSKIPPAVVDKKRQPIDESEMFGGCYAIASVTVYAYDYDGKKGVTFGLGNVQKVADGDRFGGFSSPEDDFEVWDDDDDDDDDLI
jgi:hypothetical protein